MFFQSHALKYIVIREIQFTVITARFRQIFLVYVTIEFGYVFGKFLVQCLFCLLGRTFITREHEQVQIFRETFYQPVGFGKWSSAFEVGLIRIFGHGNIPQYLRYPVILFHVRLLVAEMFSRQCDDFPWTLPCPNVNSYFCPMPFYNPLNRVIRKNGLCHFRLQTVCLMSPYPPPPFWHVAVTFRQRYDFSSSGRLYPLKYWLLTGCRCPAPVVPGMRFMSFIASSMQDKAFIRIVHASRLSRTLYPSSWNGNGEPGWSGYRYGCGNLFGQPHFVIDVSPVI